MIHANCMTTVARRVKRLVLHVYKFGAHPLKVAPRALCSQVVTPGLVFRNTCCATNNSVGASPDSDSMGESESKTQTLPLWTRTWTRTPPRWSRIQRCGLRLWSDGLGLGLTVSPVRNVQGKLRLLHATMAKIRERINEITKLVPLCSIQHCVIDPYLKLLVSMIQDISSSQPLIPELK